MSTKPRITAAEGMNAHLHKYAYNYTYICICDYLIIGKFGSSLYFVKNRLLYEARCSSNKKDNVSEFISSVLPLVVYK
jgi:hypothetical protein